MDFDLDFLRRLDLRPGSRGSSYRKFDMATHPPVLVTVHRLPRGSIPGAISGPHRVHNPASRRDIKDYKAMLETLAVKTGDHK